MLTEVQKEKGFSTYGLAIESGVSSRVTGTVYAGAQNQYPFKNVQWIGNNSFRIFQQARLSRVVGLSLCG